MIFHDLALLTAGALFMNVLEHYIYQRQVRMHHQLMSKRRRP